VRTQVKEIGAEEEQGTVFCASRGRKKTCYVAHGSSAAMTRSGRRRCCLSHLEPTRRRPTSTQVFSPARLLPIYLLSSTSSSPVPP
jgi:hypothetical protein